MLRLRNYVMLIGLSFVGLAVAVSGFAAFRGASYKARHGSHRSQNSRDAASGAIEFIVTAEEPFPARALDPVLHIGDVEVRDYRYTDIENKTLIFTSTEPDKLQDGAPVYLQYENDVSTRTDLQPFRSSQVE
jgi:hypothetical protein